MSMKIKMDLYIVTISKSELSKEVDAMLTGLTSNASVSIATSPGSITYSLCGYVRNAGNGIA